MYRVRTWLLASLAAFSCVPLAVTEVSAAEPAHCSGNPDVLGVSRTVEIDTTGGPGFGLEHYKVHDFLRPKEVVLTFDDGPQKFSTEAILAALDQQCTKATFFSIGKMALGYPQIIREVAARGHTIGTHTWSHASIPKKKTEAAMKEEIEKGVSGVARALGKPVSSFFRFPYLQDSEQALVYLGTRDIAMFSTDIDSFDFKVQPAENVVKTIMKGLETKGKGIILMHDIHKVTAKAVPLLLSELYAKGYKIVHLTSKAPAATLPEYDALIEPDAKGLPVAGKAGRPTGSIVRTIEGEPSADEAVAASEPAPIDAQVTSSIASPETKISTEAEHPAASVQPVESKTAEPDAAAPAGGVDKPFWKKMLGY